MKDETTLLYRPDMLDIRQRGKKKPIKAEIISRSNGIKLPFNWTPRFSKFIVFIFATVGVGVDLVASVVAFVVVVAERTKLKSTRL